MARYNFRSFFKGKEPVHNSEWVTNGYFLIKKSILTKSQNNFVNGFDMKENTIKQLEKNILESEMKKDRVTEFIAETINDSISVKIGEQEIKSIVFCTVEHESINITFCLNAEYYHFLKALKCNIYITEGYNTRGSLFIYKNDEFMGLVMPFRAEEKNLIDAINYKDWERQQEEEKQRKKDSMKKCLYISNNKAVVRNKELLCIADIIQDAEYKNLYVESDYKKDGGMVFIDFGFIFMYATTLSKYDVEPDSIKYKLKEVKGFTFEDYKQHVNNCLENTQFINIAEIKLMELSGEFNSKYIQMLTDHRQKVLDLQKQKRQEREAKREQEEQEFLLKKEKELQDTITAAEQAIKNNEKVINKDVTEYKASRYDSNTSSLILYLMKKYDVKVPLKTQGWVNNALANIYYDDYNEYTYQYYTSSADSTVFSKYLQELVNKVKLSA